MLTCKNISCCWLPNSFSVRISAWNNDEVKISPWNTSSIAHAVWTCEKIVIGCHICMHCIVPALLRYRSRYDASNIRVTKATMTRHAECSTWSASCLKNKKLVQLACLVIDHQDHWSRCRKVNLFPNLAPLMLPKRSAGELHGRKGTNPIWSKWSENGRQRPNLQTQN